MPDDVELLRRVYALFKGREIESVLAAMHPDVVWANGMEGGHVHGRDGVRSYWKRQRTIVDPHVEPVEISPNARGKSSSQCIKWCVTLRAISWPTDW